MNQRYMKYFEFCSTRFSTQDVFGRTKLIYCHIMAYIYRHSHTLKIETGRGINKKSRYLSDFTGGMDGTNPITIIKYHKTSIIYIPTIYVKIFFHKLSLNILCYVKKWV